MSNSVTCIYKYSRTVSTYDKKNGSHQQIHWHIIWFVSTWGQSYSVLFYAINNLKIFFEKNTNSLAMVTSKGELSAMVASKGEMSYIFTKRACTL